MIYMYPFIVSRSYLSGDGSQTDPSLPPASSLYSTFTKHLLVHEHGLVLVELEASQY